MQLRCSWPHASLPRMMGGFESRKLLQLIQSVAPTARLVLTSEA